MNGTDDSMVIDSSGNLFADLGVADPDEASVKAELARAINALVAAWQPTQTQAAELLYIDQPRVPALMRSRLSVFSVDRLLRFVLALDRDVEIVVTPKKEARNRVDVPAGGVTQPRRFCAEEMVDLCSSKYARAAALSSAARPYPPT